MKKNEDYYAIFLISLGVLLLEISLTRLFSVILWYHYAFLSLSLTLLGMSIGGTFVYILQDWIERHNWVLTFSALSYGAAFSLLISVSLTVQIHFTPEIALKTFVILFFLFILFMLPFFFTGSAIALLLRIRYKKISSLYASDLFGAAMGCLLAIPLINLIGGEFIFLFIVFLFIIVGLMVSFREHNKIFTISGFLSVIFLIILLLFPFGRSLFTIHYVKGNPEIKNKIFEGWNAYSRVAVYPYNNVASGTFFEWGIDPTLLHDIPEQLFMNIDAGAATPITKFDGDLNKLEVFKYGLPSLVYYIKEKPKILIIGPGGGNDVLRALLFESPRIDAVEYNPLIYKAVMDVCGNFSGHLYNHPSVHFHLAEGRHFVHCSHRNYDIIQASLVDTFAASSAGALTLSESTLYTTEAFNDFLKHLNPNGILSVSRYIHKPPWETLRIASLAYKALFINGCKTPQNNIVIYRSYNYSTTLVKNTPFSKNELQTLKEFSETLHFDPVWVPGQKSSIKEFNLLLDTGENGRKKFISNYDLDIQPTTDDSPFFFFVGKISNLIHPSLMKVSNVFHYQAIYILIFLLIVSFLLIIFFIFVPLWFHSKGKIFSFNRLSAPFFYFIGIGLGYMSIEVALIQRYLLPLGHPVYSLSVVLFTMLLFSSLGSALSSKIIKNNKYLILILLLIPLLLLPQLILTNKIIALLIGLSLSQRIFLTVLFIAPVSFLMGMPFPTGISFFCEDDKNLIPWVWAVNGAASVLASIIALFFAMIFNYSLVLILGSLAYLIALVSLLSMKKFSQLVKNS